MGLIDTHMHLESFARKGALDSVLQHAREAGLEAMITVGTAPDDWGFYRELASPHVASGFVRYTVGLHPCSVDADWQVAVGQMEEFWAEGRDAGPRPVALGECGLDRFHLPKDAVESEKILGWQREAFAAQLSIARKLACPVVVHSRGAFQECIEMIEASGVSWNQVVFHCFSEGAAEMSELARRGGVASFTGILTYKSADAVRAAAKTQGLGGLMLETDAPYLAPVPHRGKTNEPAYVKHIAEFAAREVFEVDYETLVETSTANARRFFGL